MKTTKKIQENKAWYVENNCIHFKDSIFDEPFFRIAKKNLRNLWGGIKLFFRLTIYMVLLMTVKPLLVFMKIVVFCLLKPFVLSINALHNIIINALNIDHIIN